MQRSIAGISVDPRSAGRWPLVLIGVSAGLAGIVRDIPGLAAILLLPAAGAAVLFLLARPLAWVPLWVGLALLVPPLPLTVGGVELPFHPAVVVFVAALFVGWARLREWRVERNLLALACFVFLAILLASLPLAFFYSGMSVGAQSVLRWLLLLQGFVLLAWTAWGPAFASGEGSFDHGSRPETALLKVVLAAALLSSAFAAVDFFYQFTALVRFSVQYIYLPDGPHRRAQGILYDASALGNFCAMMLVLVAALDRAARRQLGLPRWLLWLPVPTLSVALLLSFSRASVVNLTVSLLVLAMLRRRSLLNARSVVAGLALVGLVVVSVGMIAPDMAVRFGQRLEFTASQLFANPNEVLSMRLDAWRLLVNLVAENPALLLLGIGYKSLPYTDYFQRPIVADNMYLSLLVETGVPGLLALLLLCGALLVYGYRLSRNDEPGVAALGRFLFAFWCGQMLQMLSGDILTYWRVTPVYFAILGVTLRRSRQAALRPLPE